MIPLLESPAAQRLAWTLLHFLWQGALLGLAAWAAFALFRRQRPQLRYLVGCAFLLACLGSAILTYGLLAPPLQVVGQAADQPMNPATVAPGVPDILTGPIALPEAAAPRATLPWRARLQPYLPWILAVWVAGVLSLSLRAAGGWLWLRRLKAAATPVTEPEWLERLVRSAGLRRAVRFLESARVITPMCMGLLRPVVLLPLGFFANLDPLAAEAVLAHELAHIKRLDGLVNGLQCVIEVLFFFHPAVWWISRRIRTEREHCCDDAAVLACGDAVFYAETLSRLDECRDRPPSLALRARGGNLMERLRRLLLADPPQLRFATPSLAFVAILALVGTLPAQAERSEAKPRSEETVSALEDRPTPPERVEGSALGPLPRLDLVPSQEATPLPTVPGPVATPTPAPASTSISAPAPPATTAHPQPTPVQGSAPETVPPLPPASIPVFQAKDLDIVPGLAIRTLKVPQYPAVIVDELLTWPNKGYAVDVPGHTTVSLRITCESGEAYFRVGVADKWGNPLRGMKGSMGVPWASFANDSEQPVSVIFFVRTTKGYPGDGKIRVHVAAAFTPRAAAARTFYPAPTEVHPAPIAIPTVDVKSLPILPGMRVQTLQAPPCPVLITDASPRWSTKGYAVLVPGRSLARATLRSESSMAYLQVRALNKWGTPLEGSHHGLGTPEASFLNTSDTSTTVYFVVSAKSGYPGDGKIAILLTTEPWAPAATPSPESQSAPPAMTKPPEGPVALDSGSQPTPEEVRPLVQAVVDKTAWGATATIVGLKVRGMERWNRAFTEHWPRQAEKVRAIQAIGPVIEGWLIDFETLSRDPQNAARTSRQSFTLLMDKDRVIHWRTAYPWQRPNEALPEANRANQFGTRPSPPPPPPPPPRP
jgi:beta-lactamase regulating signal transducer with metallopeptidase domain